jgi:hypothetical protein
MTFEWEPFIKSDKTATAQFESFCLGLAKCIVSQSRRPTHSLQHQTTAANTYSTQQIENEPGAGTELTPQRLAAFYKRVGGNYDTFFLKSGDNGLSWTYRTFGCFHSLQPTSNPFEMPNVACLTPAGFARWQTLQLLLTPEESVGFLIKACQLYRIPKPDGGYYPSNIPKSCFPSEADTAMLEWYDKVNGQLNQDNYMRRLKNSPFQSPYPEDRRDGYFHSGGPSRDSSAEDQARLDAYRRRSSVPDLVSPMPVPVPVSNDRPSHWDPQRRQPRKARSHSAQRPVQNPRQRSHTTSTPDRQNKPHSAHSHHRPPSQQWSSYRPRQSDVRASHSRNNSASDASSENSHLDRKSRPQREESPKRRRDSLWPPNFFKSHRRRHSSDAGKIEPPPPKPPAPMRPEYYKRKSTAQPQPAQSPYGAAMPVYAPHAQRPPNGVRFRDDIFTVPHHPVSDQANPLGSGYDARNGLAPPTVRFDQASAFPEISRESSSGSGTDRRHHSDWERSAQRGAGMPVRVATVSGVGGRRYVNSSPVEPVHPGRVRGSAPTPV